jgi:hypothetical protein
MKEGQTIVLPYNFFVGYFSELMRYLQNHYREIMDNILMVLALLASAYVLTKIHFDVKANQ